MRILTRYIFRELVAPTALGFCFYTSIILMQRLFELAEMIIKRSLPFTTVLRLLGLSLPHIVVLTIPMALLFGILIAIGRMSSDSEIIAMRAAGISATRIYRPIFYFSLGIFLLNLYLMNVILPWGNSAFQNLRTELFASSVQQDIQRRVFYGEYENLVIYINDVSPQTGAWKGVFISDSTDPERQNITVADSGGLTAIGENRELWLELRNSENHSFSAKKPERYDLMRNAEQRTLLVDRFADDRRTKEYRKSLREMGLRELFAELPASKRRDRLEYRLNLVEIHKKFSIPFACLAFGVIGLPLGITNRRGGKSSGFSLSLAIIVIYYIMITNGEDLARSGALPAALSMWAPNAVLIAFGLYLLSRANTDRDRHHGFAAFFTRVANRIARIRHKRMAARAVTNDDAGLLSRLDISFPNTLDRYVLREFLKILGMVLISTAILFLIVDYTELIEDITQNNIPFDVVASYYRYYILHVLDWTLPVSVLLATLITFGILAKNNEVTAIKANGVSLYRIAMPILAVAAVISLFSYFLLDFVLPYSNQRVAELQDRIRGRQTARSYTMQRQWIFGKGRYLFNYLNYDRRTRSLSEVQVFEFDPEEFRLTRRVWADEARFDGTGWVFVNGWVRSFGPDASSSFTPIDRPVRLHYPERPSYFEVEAKTPNQMSFAELRRYINSMRRSGYAVDDLTVDLWKKTSWPLISLVMSLIALPFAFRSGKRGALYGVGIALAVGFVYWTIFGIFTKFGEVGNLPAALSAWSANILFAIAATYLFLRVET